MRDPTTGLASTGRVAERLARAVLDGRGELTEILTGHGPRAEPALRRTPEHPVARRGARDATGPSLRLALVLDRVATDEALRRVAGWAGAPCRSSLWRRRLRCRTRPLAQPLGHLAARRPEAVVALLQVLTADGVGAVRAHASVAAVRASGVDGVPIAELLGPVAVDPAALAPLRMFVALGRTQSVPSGLVRGLCERGAGHRSALVRAQASRALAASGS